MKTNITLATVALTLAACSSDKDSRATHRGKYGVETAATDCGTWQPLPRSTEEKGGME